MLPEKEREMSLCFNLTQTVTLLMVNCVMIGLELERRGKSLSTHRWACSCFLHGSSCNHRLQAACTEEGRRGSVGQTWSCFYKTFMLGFRRGREYPTRTMSHSAIGFSNNPPRRLKTPSWALLSARLLLFLNNFLLLCV